MKARCFAGLLAAVVFFTAGTVFAKDKEAASESSSDEDKTIDDTPWYVPQASELDGASRKGQKPVFVWAATEAHYPQRFSGGIADIRLQAEWMRTGLGFSLGTLRDTRGRLSQVGFHALRQFGYQIAGANGPYQLYLLAPDVTLRLQSDFDTSFLMMIGTGLTGLRLCTCGGSPAPFPIAIEFRAPVANLWFPFAVDVDKSHLWTSTSSLGFSLMAGTFF